MTDIIPIFIGYDPRQPISLSALMQSIIAKSSLPVAITPLVLDTLPIKRQGLTPFTYSRFLVPYLMGYEGFGIFLDADILLNADIAELWALRDYSYLAQAVPHDGGLKFERASVIIFNNKRCKILAPEYVETANNLHTMGWAREDEIGELPKEWNHLVGYDAPNPNAKLIHYTQGIPAFPETTGCEFTKEWQDAAKMAHSSVPWKVLMGNSVHAQPVYERLRLSAAE